MFMNNKEANIDPQTLLADFGLNPKESAVYLACLALGQAGVTRISDEADVPRTYVYAILEKLLDTGFVSKVESKSKDCYSAVDPDNIYASQMEKMERFEHLLPTLHSLSKRSKTRPRVQFFEGEAGVMSAMNDSLRIPKDSEILSYSSGEGINLPDKQFQIEYIHKRVERRIRVRAIAPDTPHTRFYTDQDAKHLRETRLVAPETFPFTANEINIYGNKVSMISFESEMVAVVIESGSITNGQRAIFELAWKGAGK